MKITKSHLRESHERQFNGEDYQAVAHDIANRIGLSPETDEGRDAWLRLETEPDPGCGCGFCEGARWLE